MSELVSCPFAWKDLDMHAYVGKGLFVSGVCRTIVSGGRAEGRLLDAKVVCLVPTPASWLYPASCFHVCLYSLCTYLR